MGLERDRSEQGAVAERGQPPGGAGGKAVLSQVADGSPPADEIVPVALRQPLDPDQPRRARSRVGDAAP